MGVDFGFVWSGVEKCRMIDVIGKIVKKLSGREGVGISKLLIM